MKIYISADMEGIFGIVSLSQTNSGDREYERARRMMTREVNAVIEAAFAYGASEVVINDSHSNMDNILLEELNPKAALITGSPKPMSMMEGIDESFDAVFFVGYHGRPGTPKAVIDHLYAFRVLEARINGKPMSEAGLNGRIAGLYDVPVALVTGDQNAIIAAREELNDPVGVVVKNAVGRTSAKVYPFPVIQKKLKEGVAEAMKKIKDLQPTVEKGNVELEVSFSLADMAEMTLLIPGVQKKGTRTVIYSASNYLDAFKVFRVMLSLTSGIR